MATTEEVKKEKFDIGKLLRGFNIFNGETLGKIIQQVIIVLVILGIAGAVVYKIGQRTEHTTQSAQQITNIEKKDGGFRVLGIELFGFRS